MAGAEAVFRATSQMAHDYSHTDPKTGHKLMGKSTDREEGRLEGVRWRGCASGRPSVVGGLSPGAPLR